MKKTYTVTACYSDGHDSLKDNFTVEAENEADAKERVCDLIINEMNYPFVTSLEIIKEEK
mgnify:CR=1 FL=1